MQTHRTSRNPPKGQPTHPTGKYWEGEGAGVEALGRGECWEGLPGEGGSSQLVTQRCRKMREAVAGSCSL